MDTTKLKDIFDQIEYYLIRLLLLALLLISSYKLLEREIHGAEVNERPHSITARLTMCMRLQFCKSRHGV